MTDFAYNLGVARYRASTLRKRVDDGDWEDAKAQLALWTRGGGRVLPGLVRRRAAEAALL
jgi:lysozyme